MEIIAVVLFFALPIFGFWLVITLCTCIDRSAEWMLRRGLIPGRHTYDGESEEYTIEDTIEDSIPDIEEIEKLEEYDFSEDLNKSMELFINVLKGGYIKYGE